MLLLIFLFVAAVAEYPHWRHVRTGAEFDFSQYSRPSNDPWQITDETTGKTFYFNLDSDVKGRWASAGVVSERRMNDGSIEWQAWGYNVNRRLQLISNNDPFDGVKITYANGDLCTDSHEGWDHQPRKTIFELRCSETSNGDWDLLTQESIYKDCHTTIQIKSKYACPVDFYGGFFGSYSLTLKQVILISILGALVFYLFIQIIYRNCFQDENKESDGTRASWREVPDLVKEGVIYAYQRVHSVVSAKEMDYCPI